MGSVRRFFKRIWNNRKKSRKTETFQVTSYGPQPTVDGGVMNCAVAETGTRASYSHFQPAYGVTHSAQVFARPSLSNTGTPLSTQQEFHASTPATSGFLYGAQNVAMYNPIMQDITYGLTEEFMKEFAKHTIPGSGFDSSARDPPPRCHPGTRLLIVERLCNFKSNPHGRRLLWLVGPAGVGKSAIMQTVAETVSDLGAALFFTVGVRDDPSKVITTLAYQIATRYPPYQELIRKKMTADPTITEKSMVAQFDELILEPFAKRNIYPGPNPLLMLIDGLDECRGVDKQFQLLNVIARFVVNYPSAPLVWIIASRPEPHITAFFAHPNIIPVHARQDIQVDESQAREDVERFLRNQLELIRAKHPILALRSQWPNEHEFLKLAAAALGWFAYASTVVKFIDDPAYGNPESQIKKILNIIDNTPRPTNAGGHPMAPLYALYSGILSHVPDDVLPDTQFILLTMALFPHEPRLHSFVGMCNWLRISPDVAYGALYHLHSALKIPPPGEAHKVPLSVHHKSFMDYLLEFNDVPRWFSNTGDRPSRDFMKFKLALQFLGQLPERVDTRNGLYPLDYIELHWPPPLRSLVETAKEDIYASAVHDLIFSPTFRERLLDQDPDVFHCLRVVSADRLSYHADQILKNWYFDESIWVVLKDHRFFHEIAIRDLDLSCIRRSNPITVGYCSQEATIQNPGSDCPLHEFYRSPRKMAGYSIWTRYNPFAQEGCRCIDPILDCLRWVQENSPEMLATAFIGPDNSGLVVYDLVDPEDEVARWLYAVPYTFPSSVAQEFLL